MKTDLKNAIKKIAKENNIPLYFHRYGQGECSCCYGPHTEIFINTNIPHNRGGRYYKVSYETSIDKENFYTFAEQLKEKIEKEFNKEYEFSFDFNREIFGDKSILINII